MNYLRKKFVTIDEAEDAFGITVDSYLASSPATESSPSNPEQGPIKLPEKIVEIIETLTGVQRAMLANITPILPLDRMPFGLIQYQLEFFNAAHICQANILFIIII